MTRNIGVRRTIVVLHDLFMTAFSFVLALYLRLGDGFFELDPAWLSFHTALFVLCAAPVFWAMGLYRGIWRFASLNDLVSIVKAIALAGLVYLPVAFALTRLDRLPRSLIVIEPLLLMVLLGAPRIAYRLWKDGRLDLRRVGRDQRVPVLLIGAGDGAEQFVRAMEKPGAAYQVVGIVSVEHHRVGARLHGVEVVGQVDGDFATIVERIAAHHPRPQRAVITRDDLSGERVSALLDATGSMGMVLSRLPKLTEFKEGNGAAVQLRPVSVEDLLNRPQTVLDRAGMRALIGGRTVVVTGAGGSIGSELVLQIASFDPARLVLIDNSEYHLYLIDMVLHEQHPDISRAPVIADVRDRDRIFAVLSAERPELVFHAAALKHVPMVELNPAEGVLTNVHGTRNVADACRALGVRAMVMISTDKAVNPSNVMGATKRAAESYCQALDLLDAGKPDRTCFVTVRFGNVLGSTGSVVPLFQRQLAKGGPLTVTHPDVERYFMTIREAVSLVLQASVLRCEDEADPTEGGRLFVLDMGSPVRIADLAEQMIRLAGLRPGVDVDVRFTGLRPGEKLTEELFHLAEALVPTTVKGIQLAAPRTVEHPLLERSINSLVDAARTRNLGQMHHLLKLLVPEYAANLTLSQNSACTDPLDGQVSSAWSPLTPPGSPPMVSN